MSSAFTTISRFWNGSIILHCERHLTVIKGPSQNHKTHQQLLNLIVEGGHLEGSETKSNEH